MMGLTQSSRADIALFECLAGRQRRAVVAALRAASADLSERDLAAHTVARLEGKAPDDVSDHERDRTRVTLHHRDLPKLASADIVDYDPEDGRVALVDHPALDDPGIRSSIESPSSSASVDALFEALADGRRQRVLAIVRKAEGPISLRDAAAHLAAHEQGCSREAVAPDVVDRVHTDLWHVHLPKFREAGLVSYDEDDETLTYEGHPDLRSAWLHSDVANRPVDA